MPLDARVKRFLDTLAAGHAAPAASQSVAARRASLSALLQFGGPPAPVAGIQEASLRGPTGPIPVRIYSPQLASPPERDALLPALIYLHGGGFVAGSLDTHEGLARSLTQVGACRVVSVGYRLAPEHPFPAALEDAAAAVREIARCGAQFGIDGTRLGICGDSAGGTLAAATCQTLRREAGPRLALQLLICPILDYSRSSASRREFAAGFLIDEDTLAHDLRCYLPPGTDPKDARISPLRAADLAGLPHTLMHTAEYDPVRDDGRAYAARLAESGIPVSYTCHAGMIHLFYGLGGIIPQARTALEHMGAQVRAILGGEEFNDGD